MNIVIINTNCANLFSVQSMLSKLGYDAIISDRTNIIEQADKLFLPGVGTAAAAMNHLKKKISEFYKKLYKAYIRNMLRNAIT